MFKQLQANEIRLQADYVWLCLLGHRMYTAYVIVQ